MINKINLFSANKLTQRKFATQPVFKQHIGREDTFEISGENKLKTAQNIARERAIAKMQEKNATCGVVMDSKGKITDEFVIMGNGYPFRNNELPKDSTIIIASTEHAPLNAKSVARLLTSDAKSIEVVTKDGQFSRLTKNDKNIRLKDRRNLANELTHQLYSRAAKKAGINLKPTQDDYIELARDYLQNTTGKDCSNYSLEEINEKLAQQKIKTSGDVVMDYRQLSRKCKGYTFYVVTTKYKRILHKENEINAFLATKEGFEVKQDFLKKTAEKYDLTYESNMTAQ